MKTYRTDGEDVTFIVEWVDDDKYDPSNPNPEANLDLQFAFNDFSDAEYLLQHRRCDGYDHRSRHPL